MEGMLMILSVRRQSVRCPARFRQYLKCGLNCFLQRSLAAASNVIMDGRDIGTHVLPNADVKVFLTADAHVRALRRYEEFTAKGINCTLENVEREVIERDERDMNRAIAPLKQAEDAVRVDTSQMNIDEVVNCLRQLILDRI